MGIMKRAFLLLAATLGLVGCAYDPLKPLDPISHIAPGIYGNIRVGERTGDMAGYELRLAHGGASREIEITACEGSCNRVHHLPLTRDGDDLRFSLPRGNDAPPRQMQLTPLQGGLLLTEVMGAGADGAVLRPMRREHGLAVARSNGGDTPPPANR